MKRWMGILSVVLMVFLMAGCGFFGEDTLTDTEKFVLKLTDAPADNIAEVWVTINKVEVQAADQEDRLLINDFSDNPVKVNLLSLRFDELVIGDTELPVGEYNNIFLSVDSNPGNNYVILLDGSQAELKVPSSELKVPHTFRIEKGVVTELIMDADIREFIGLRGNEDSNNGYVINPTAIARAIRVFERTMTSQIVGQVLDIDGNPITGVSVMVDVYDTSGNFVTGTIALAEEILNEDNEVIHEAGSFVIKGLLAGDYYLTVTAEGYETLTTEILTLTAEHNLNVGTINLTPITP